jgi:hypothetical protein
MSDYLNTPDRAVSHSWFFNAGTQVQREGSMSIASLNPSLNPTFTI